MLGSPHLPAAGRACCGAAGTSCRCAGRRSAAPTSVGDLGDELHGAGARADDGDALAAQVVVVVPARPSGSCGRRRSSRPAIGGIAGWCSWPVAITDARRRSDVRPSRSVTVHGASSSSQRARRDLGVGHDEVVDAVLAGDPAQVVEDLRLRRAQARPVAALGEGERVQVARDVAGRARVGVVEPGAAQLGRALEDRDVARSRGCAARSRPRSRRSRPR